MNSADVIGYTKDGSCYCDQCGESAGYDLESEKEGTEVCVIFPDSETDSPCHCDECWALIPERLTSDGVRYVHEAFRRFLRSHGTDGRLEILVEWAHEFDHVPGARFFLSRASKYEKVG
jgi:hypothetical protein